MSLRYDPERCTGCQACQMACMDQRDICPAEGQTTLLRVKPVEKKHSLTFRLEHCIGCAACVYSQGNAYLWYLASKRKSFPMQHPNLMTVWHALQYSHSHGYQHIYFLDVGLPFSHNPYREFILRFGGKPASTYRWFRCSLKWVNKILNWLYRE